MEHPSSGITAYLQPSQHTLHHAPAPPAPWLSQISDQKSSGCMAVETELGNSQGCRPHLQSICPKAPRARPGHTGRPKVTDMEETLSQETTPGKAEHGEGKRPGYSDTHHASYSGG